VPRRQHMVRPRKIVSGASGVDCPTKIAPAWRTSQSTVGPPNSKLEVLRRDRVRHPTPHAASASAHGTVTPQCTRCDLPPRRQASCRRSRQRPRLPRLPWSHAYCCRQLVVLRLGEHVSRDESGARTLVGNDQYLARPATKSMPPARTRVASPSQRRCCQGPTILVDGRDRICSEGQRRHCLRPPT